MYVIFTLNFPGIKLVKSELRLHHLKTLSERISGWAYFLNLAKQFCGRCLNFSAPKNGFFLDKTWRELS